MAVPNSQHRLIVGSTIDPVWFRYLQSLDGKASASDIAAIATALGSPDGTVANIPPLSSSTVTILQGAGIAVTRGESGEYYIALRPLGDSGAGTFKLITRDATGRISGSLDGTAADVPYDNATSGLAATNVQTAVDELSAEKLDDAPSDGSEYVRKDGAWEATTSGAGGAMTLVGSAFVAGSAATDMTVSSLDLATDGSYIVQVSLKSAVAANDIRVFFNGDSTATNYGRAYLLAGAGAGASGANNNNTAAIGQMGSGEKLTGSLTVLLDLDNYPRAHGHVARGGKSNLATQDIVIAYEGGTNATSITISASVASGLAVGSYLKVFKVG